MVKSKHQPAIIWFVGLVALLWLSLAVILAPVYAITRGATGTPAGPLAPPGRATAIPSTGPQPPTPSPSRTPPVTSIFVFPTPHPIFSPTPERRCIDVFPIENIEAITFGQTTLIQLEARFGRATRDSGRANRFRFGAGGCEMRALIGVQETLEIELIGYGTLGWLLARYGPPQAAGISQGNLTLRDVGHTILLYPQAGLIAEFGAVPDTLTPDTVSGRLTFRPPFEAERQMNRLKALPVAWSPPVSWYRTGSPTPED